MTGMGPGRRRSRPEAPRPDRQRRIRFNFAFHLNKKTAQPRQQGSPGPAQHDHRPPSTRHSPWPSRMVLSSKESMGLGGAGFPRNLGGGAAAGGHRAGAAGDRCAARARAQSPTGSRVAPTAGLSTREWPGSGEARRDRRGCHHGALPVTRFAAWCFAPARIWRWGRS